MHVWLNDFFSFYLVFFVFVFVLFFGFFFQANSVLILVTVVSGGADKNTEEKTRQLLWH